jgi:hypothetical protein
VSKTCQGVLVVGGEDSVCQDGMIPRQGWRGRRGALFAFPPEGLVIQYSTLALCTLLVGAAFGLTRHLCGSVLPALTAHVPFDILVYGDWAQAPWWVWG